MARPSAPLALTPAEAATLGAHAATGPEPHRRAAAILLLLADGVAGSEVARRLETSPQTVCAWRMRFLRQRMQAFGRKPGDQPRAGPALPADVEPQPTTLQNIADLIGVHRSTVHRVLHGRRSDDSALARRIRTAARDLGYRSQPKDPERLAMVHRFRPNAVRRQVMFYLPESAFRSPFFTRMANGALDALAGSRFDAVVRLSDDLAERQLPPAFERGEIAAVISHDHPGWLEIQQSRFEQLPHIARPTLVGLLRSPPGTWGASVDFTAAAHGLASHLLDLGHRRFIAIEERPACTAGFRAALTERGLDPDTALTVMHVVPDRLPQQERIAITLRLLLERQPTATALLAANDPLALLVARQLEAWGRPVPQSMSVTGFDDTDRSGWLTSVTLPLEEIGRAAAHLAMEPGTEPRDLLLPTALRTGSSTGPPPR